MADGGEGDDGEEWVEGGGDAPPAAAPTEEPTVDAEGYLISNRGKFQAQVNPLQLRLMEEKRRAEERAAEEAKRAKLASKLAAFGGGVSKAPARGAAADAAAAAAAAAAKKPAVPEMAAVVLDGKFKEMMSSGIVSTRGRGTALLSSRGRGVRARGGSAAAAGGAAGRGGTKGASCGIRAMLPQAL